MRALAIFFLVLFAGSMLYVAYLVLGTIVLAYWAEIFLTLYLLRAVFEFFRTILVTYTTFSEASARLSGGLRYKVTKALFMSKLSAIGRLLVYLSIAAEALVISISWPATWLLKRFAVNWLAAGLDISSQNGDRVPALYYIALFQVQVLISRVVTVLLTCIAIYALIALVGAHAGPAKFIFAAYIIFANLVLLTIVCSPVQLATMLRQQPRNPYLLLAFLFISLVPIQILSFTGMSHFEALRQWNAVEIVGMTFLKHASLFEFFSHPPTSPLEIWTLVSHLLFFSVVGKLIFRPKQLSRTDADWVILASRFLSVGDSSHADDCLKKVKVPDAAYLRSLAVVHYQKGDSGKAYPLMVKAAATFISDWPEPTTPHETEFFPMSFVIQETAIPKEAVENATSTFFSKNPRPILYSGISELLFLNGRLSPLEIEAHLKSAPTGNSHLGIIVVLVLGGQKSEARRILESIEPQDIAHWRPADLLVFQCWRLLVQISEDTYLEQDLVAVHTWCSTSTAEIKILLAKAIEGTDIIGLMICFSHLTVIEKIIAGMAPMDALALSEMANQCKQFLAQFKGMEEFGSLVPIALKEVVTMMDHPESMDA